MYSYYLEGYDKTWSSWTEETKKEYMNLPEGDYTFKVKAKRLNESVSDEATYEFSISPPWYRTSPAFIVFFFLIMAVVYLLAKGFSYRLAKDNQRLEALVEARTAEIHAQKEKIEKQKNEIEQSYQEVEKSYQKLNEINEELSSTLGDLKQTQTQLVQSEKMASLGQLTAGLAHEINNPINFVSAGIDSLSSNYTDLSELLEKVSTLTSDKDNTELLQQIEKLKKEIDLDCLIEEIPQLLKSIKTGAHRTTEIVKSLRNFTRLDENDLKQANIHEGLESTLVILQNQLADRVEVVKEYGNLPTIACYPGQLNQVFMNILNNAVQAIEGTGKVYIHTALRGDLVEISIRDTGKGMNDETKRRIFEPFFTTKDVGEGTGLGLSISYSIIEKHHGSIAVESTPGLGTTFIVRIPLHHKQ